MKFIPTLELWYSYVQSQGDPRVKDWVLSSHWAVPAGIVICYLLIVWLGPKFMNDRKSRDLRPTMIAYNIGVVFLNLYILYEVSTSCILLGSCSSSIRIHVPSNKSYQSYEIRLINALWLCYISKIIELLDTLFFILRKKKNQITFLHVYHHSTVIIWGWILLKWHPGGIVVYIPLINCFVHVVMYIYYGLSAIGPSMKVHLWWKKYVTILQQAQFCVGISIMILYNNIEKYSYPKGLFYTGSVYLGVQFLLFTNFYFKNFIRAPKNPISATKENSAAKSEKIN